MVTGVPGQTVVFGTACAPMDNLLELIVTDLVLTQDPNVTSTLYVIVESTVATGLGQVVHDSPVAGDQA